MKSDRPRPEGIVAAVAAARAIHARLGTRGPEDISVALIAALHGADVT